MDTPIGVQSRTVHHHSENSLVLASEFLQTVRGAGEMAHGSGKDWRDGSWSGSLVWFHGSLVSSTHIRPHRCLL